MTDKQVQKVETTAIEPVENPMMMLHRMIEAGHDPDKLERMIDLAERYEANVAKKEYAEAMSRAQNAMPRVVKDKENSHTRSRYASLENVQVRIKPVYMAEGFTVSFSEVEPMREGNIRLRALVRHISGHSEEFFREAPVDSKGPKGNNVKSELHGSQSTVSYLSRNMLLEIFGVTVADRDDDGNAGSGVECIGEKDAIRLTEWLESVGGNVDQFCRYYGIDSIDDLPKSRLAHAEASIKRKEQNQGGGK